MTLFALAATSAASTSCMDDISHDTIAFFSGAALTFGSNYTDASDCGLRCATIPACQAWLFTNGGQCELFRQSPVATAANPNFTYGVCKQANTSTHDAWNSFVPSSSHPVQSPTTAPSATRMTCGSGPLRVPGFNGIPLDYEFDIGQRFTHGARENTKRQPFRLTAPELHMLRLMERITDIENWHQGVFDEDTLSEWHAQATSCANHDSDMDQDVDMDLITTRAWLWCVAELQDKARAFRDTGHVLVLNSDSGICKADRGVTDVLMHQLQDALSQLPKCSTHDLVDPSLHMLIYGRTAVLSHGGRVSLKDTCDMYPSSDRRHMAPIHEQPRRKRSDFSHRSDDLKDQQVSSCYQWLPCEVEFAESSGTAVRITSYINNLHPENFQAYASIEKLISLAIRPWNDVLVKGFRGRTPRRIYTYGVSDSKKPPFGEYPPKDLLPVVWDQQITRRAWTAEEWESHCDKVKEYLQLPDVDPKYRVFPPEPDDPPEAQDLLGLMTPEMWASPESVKRIVEAKWRRLHRFSFPEPGISYTYEDWKMGKTANPILGPWESEIRYEMPQDHEYYSVSLEDQFRQQGLQVIVRVFSIDLTANEPHYPGDQEFHVDGMLNEHIVATAHFCYSSENITESRISYQQNDQLRLYGHQPDPLCIYKLYGMPPCPAVGEEPKALNLQTLGSVAVTHGRLLAWSNTLRYKKHPFSLLDPSRPGHQRCVVLWLVDPHYRICSTRNVPPQQHDWWRNAVLSNSTLLSTLPKELVDMVMKETGSWPMPLSEALEYKERSDEERKKAHQAQMSGFNNYQFCFMHSTA
ncbi:hypothetical protein ASPBRDRAFT_53352 [Aspergillus brasiliensis CBS 101740]|uniref:Apple domain-containing protein n=1 Tax=Aspergillus brasiliensis (strain CBS 101740 / IMI 381727 / IBT 21946) TaxID=767769 RepID=A0A1L9UN79_ASPBC|nr:hypothetical protein ASPBRDRAFT_53352 [Aspergillus brasiliensis CBS 101740]